MTYIKKSIILFICLFIIIMPFFSYNNIDFSYADSSDWMYIIDMEHSQQRDYFVGAIKSYMAAEKKYLTFSYAIDKAITEWSYNKFNDLAKLKGYGSLGEYYDQVAFKKDNGILKFFYTSLGLRLMDDIIKAIFEEYGINIYDRDSEQIYSGEFFTDDDGNSCYIYIAPSETNDYDVKADFDENILYGTIYRFDGLVEFNNLSTGTSQYTLHYNNGSNTVVYYLTKWDDFSQYSRFYDILAPTTSIPSSIITNKNVLYSSISPDNSTNYYTKSGHMCIMKIRSNNKYYLGLCNVYTRGPNGLEHYYLKTFSSELQNFTVQNQNINLDSDDNNYQDWTPYKNGIIAIEQGINDIKELLEDLKPDATMTEDEPEPEQDPVPPDSVTPNPDSPIINPGNPDFNFQMPDLDIEWRLKFNAEDLPFPFSIPFDLKNAFDSLNVIPQAPRFQGSVDLVITTWDIDIDFSPYNDYAEIIRKWFVFVYVVGLIVATRAVMHIY